MFFELEYSLCTNVFMAKVIGKRLSVVGSLVKQSLIIMSVMVELLIRLKDLIVMEYMKAKQKMFKLVLH
jgi:hypothetical protein